MSQLLPFIVIGLVSGSVYSLAATGLVLTYKTSGIFNFGHGAVATVAVYVFYILHDEHGLAWPAAGFISVFVLGPILGVLLELGARRLADVATVYKIVATVGLVLAVQGYFTATYGVESQTFPHYLPTSNAFTVAGTLVSWEQVIVTVIALAAAAALSAFLRFTRIGLAMRGVVDNADLLDASGTNPTAVRRWSWVIGATFACLAGVLLAPDISLDALLLTLLVVQAFGAAALGFFSSLPLTYIGGLVVGVLASVATKYGAVTTANALLAGLSPSVPFLVLFLVLVVTPRRRLASRRLAPRALVADQWRAPWRIQVGGAVVLAGLLVAVPALVGSADLPFYIVAVVTVILFLSLGMLVKTSGQVSLAHAGFAAIGAAAMSHFTGGLGLPWLVALVLAGLVAVPVGAFIAIPAIRLSGVFLALATFGFGIALEQMGYPLEIMFGTGTSGDNVPRPDWGPFASDRGYYYLVLAFVAVATLAVAYVHRSRLGRLLRGLGDSPVALATHGASINTTRLLVFSISAFMAAVYGALYGGAVTSVTGTSFASFTSLIWIAVLAISVGGEPWYAFVAAAGLILPGAYISNANLTNWLNLLFGVAAVAIAMSGGPRPMLRLRRIADRLGGRTLAADSAVPSAAAEAGDGRAAADAGGAFGTADQVPAGHAPGGPSPAAPAAARPGTGLEVERLTVSYGGHVAVKDFSLSAPAGRITGLIGPNGAGKTTTFNACCGLQRATTGRVSLHGRDVSGLGPAARARHGLGRTFQRMELFDSMTVRDNVALGREASMAGIRPWRHLASGPGERAVVGDAVAAAAESAGIANLLDRPVGTLSTGTRRLVELARCLAGPFDLLLLDEPSSGLTRPETERFGEVLKRVAAERDIGVLLIEHDMTLVMDVCQYIYVLDFGLPVFEGTPAAVAASDVVRAAYLGSEPVTARPDMEVPATAVPGTAVPGADPATSGAGDSRGAGA